MSTNYSLMRRDPRTRKAVFGEHIGKSTSGTFLFNGQNFRTYYDWMTRLSNLGSLESIVDEYGDEVTFDTLKAVLKRAKPIDLSPCGIESLDKITKRDFERGVCWIDVGFQFSDREFS